MESWRRADVPVLPGSGPAPRLYDTATGELVPAAAGRVATLYACGITPYDATHMGHAATYTAWDLLVRAWLDARYDRRLRAERHRRRRPAAGAGRPGRRGLARAGPPGNPAVPRGHGGAAGPAAGPPDRGGRGAAGHRAVQRPDGRPGRPVQRGRGRLLRPVGGPGVRLAFRAGHAQRLRPGRDGRDRRGARRRPGPSRQEGPARRPGLAGGAARRAGLGIAVRPRPARLARRVRGDRHRVPG